MRLLSPLRYPGSKRNLVDLIKESIEINELKPDLYIEPFIGGGSVAINLLNDNIVNQAILVDLDPWITSFWHSVFFDTHWLIDQIQTMQASIGNWYAYKKSMPSTIRDQAITCFYLNRTSFSGILEERAGPLGGKDQLSAYPIDCRFTPTTRTTIIKRILEIAQLRDRVIGIWNCSWEVAIQRIQLEQSENKLPQTNLFYYLDPPFFEEADSLYRYYFLDDDHLKLRDFLLTLKDKWVLSYDSADQVKTLYGEAIKKGTNGTQHHDIELLYSLTNVSKRKKGKEIIITNLEKIPKPIMTFDRNKKKEH